MQELQSLIKDIYKLSNYINSSLVCILKKENENTLCIQLNGTNITINLISCTSFYQSNRFYHDREREYSAKETLYDLFRIKEDLILIAKEKARNELINNYANSVVNSILERNMSITHD